MNSLATQLSHITAKSAGEATDLLTLARQACLKASYHPVGGHSPKAVIPITHTVYIEGTTAQIESFLSQIGEAHEEPNTP